MPGHLAWRRLGVGHRAETWLTWSVDHWAPAVVKLPRPDQLDHPRAAAALAREADALTRASHPALARLLDDRCDASPPHLVLEWIDGPALDEALDEHGPLPAAEVLALAAQLLALAAQLAAVLRRLHACGLAHLDLTPANVVLRDGWPTLIDLGAARPLGAPAPGPGAVGTPGYTAPEPERGEVISASMDLYGLGAVLRDALGPDAPGPDAPGPDALGGPLAAVVATLLAPDPAERPADADALLGALRAAATDATGPPWPRFASRALRPASVCSSVGPGPRNCARAEGLTHRSP